MEVVDLGCKGFIGHVVLLEELVKPALELCLPGAGILLAFLHLVH